MKDTTTEPTPQRAEDSIGNRRLIRPSLARNNHDHNHGAPSSERRERPERGGGGDRSGGGGPAARKVAPPEQTNAENFYYQKQMQTKTSMVVVLCDGEEVHGIIEWYDRNCIKINRTSGPNLMIYKPSIKYLYKEGENS